MNKFTDVNIITPKWPKQKGAVPRLFRHQRERVFVLFSFCRFTKLEALSTDSNDGMHEGFRLKCPRAVVVQARGSDVALLFASQVSVAGKYPYSFDNSALEFTDLDVTHSSAHAQCELPDVQQEHGAAMPGKKNRPQSPPGNPAVRGGKT